MAARWSRLNSLGMRLGNLGSGDIQGKAPTRSPLEPEIRALCERNVRERESAHFQVMFRLTCLHVTPGGAVGLHARGRGLSYELKRPAREDASAARTTTRFDCGGKPALACFRLASHASEIHMGEAAAWHVASASLEDAKAVTRRSHPKTRRCPWSTAGYCALLEELCTGTSYGAACVSSRTDSFSRATFEGCSSSHGRTQGRPSEVAGSKRRHNSR
jgi:hypothetical protein